MLTVEGTAPTLGFTEGGSVRWHQPQQFLETSSARRSVRPDPSHAPNSTEFEGCARLPTGFHSLKNRSFGI